MARGLRLPPAPFGPDGVVSVGLSGTLDLSSKFSSLVVRGPGAIRARAIVRRNSGDLVLKLGGRSVHARITRGIDAIAN